MADADPITSYSDEVLEMAAEWRAQGRRVAIATVVDTWGSSPRPLGSQLLVDEHGAFLGSVSGGCIEGAVIAEEVESRLGLPVVEIEVPPLSDTVSPRLRTRVEALIEVARERREA